MSVTDSTKKQLCVCIGARLNGLQCVAGQTCVPAALQHSIQVWGVIIFVVVASSIHRVQQVGTNVNHAWLRHGLLGCGCWACRCVKTARREPQSSCQQRARLHQAFGDRLLLVLTSAQECVGSNGVACNALSHTRPCAQASALITSSRDQPIYQRAWTKVISEACLASRAS